MLSTDIQVKGQKSTRNPNDSSPHLQEIREMKWDLNPIFLIWIMTIELSGQTYGHLEQSPQAPVHIFATHFWDLHFSSAMNVPVVLRRYNDAQGHLDLEMTFTLNPDHSIMDIRSVQTFATLCT